MLTPTGVHVPTLVVILIAIDNVDSNCIDLRVGTGGRQKKQDPVEARGHTVNCLSLPSSLSSRALPSSVLISPGCSALGFSFSFLGPDFPSMPARTEGYEVLLDFVNDTHDCATIQLLRDYGRNAGAIVLLQPGESVTLVLDAGTFCSINTSGRLSYPPPGSIYQYALKTRSKVVNVT